MQNHSKYLKKHLSDLKFSTSLTNKPFRTCLCCRLLSSDESRNENLLTTPSAISGSVYNTLSSKSSSVIYTPESFASGSSMNASSVFSEEIARNSSALTKNSSAPFMSEDPALVNLFNSFFPQGFFDDDHRHHPP